MRINMWTKEPEPNRHYWMQDKRGLQIVYVVGADTGRAGYVQSIHGLILINKDDWFHPVEQPATLPAMAA